MSQIDDVLGLVPVDQIAQQVGADPAEVEQAARAALPALFGGLQANAQDPAGRDSILGALDQHSSSVVEGGATLDQIDPADGQAITGHIFGANQEAVVNKLGGSVGGGSGLVQKLLPILAPIVLSYLTKQLSTRAGGGQGSGGQGGGVLGGLGGGASQSGAGAGGSDPLNDLLGSILGGAQGGSGQSGAAGSILTDLLGGLLGGGRR